MNKWLIFMRESDGAYFLWNGIRIIYISEGGHINTSIIVSPKQVAMLDTILQSRTRVFLLNEARCQVMAKGEFKGT